MPATVVLPSGDFNPSSVSRIDFGCPGRLRISALPRTTATWRERIAVGTNSRLMRRISLEFVPTAILSRQVAVVRGKALILNLPGQPKSIRETLEGLKSPEGKTTVAGIFAAVPYCIDLIGGPYLETREEVVKAFRPKSAIRPKAP